MKNKSLIALVLVVMTLISCTSGEEKAKNNNLNSTVGSRIQIPGTDIYKLLNSEVCMVNNKFMSKEQIPVPVGNKTYYGCCAGCVSKLKNDATSRYAPDPLTKEMVDKAIAVIIVKPGTKDEVLYFKSESNLKKYIGDQNKN